MSLSACYASEDSRIRAHLLGALDVLRAADTATLEAPAREARLRNVAELERYIDRGRYPRNASSKGPRLPALIDPWGTRCALAHLIESSGGGQLLDRLRGLGNHAWVRELSGDAGLVSWLRAVPPIDSPFPEPVHYLGAAGALLLAGTSAYFFVRRRS